MAQEWCLPTVSAAFVCQIEDVLDLYAEPLDERMPVVCFDETPTHARKALKRLYPA